MESQHNKYNLRFCSAADGDLIAAVCFILII
jgi:hypothetical protein